MALAYPLDLRNSGIALRRVTFSLRRSIATATLPAGLQVMEIGVGIWRARIECLPTRDLGRAAAFVEALQGATTFLCFSPTACWPAAHPGGAIAGAWADTLAVTARTETTITATAPNAALRLRAGDLVGLEQAGRYGLFRVLKDAQPAAGAIVLDVLPRVPSFFTAGAVLRLKQPVCEMILDPGSEPDMGDALSLSPVSWSAIQKVA